MSEEIKERARAEATRILGTTPGCSTCLTVGQRLAHQRAMHEGFVEETREGWRADADTIARLTRELDESRRALQFYKDREAHYARVLGVDDGGRFRADWDGAIDRLVRRATAAEAKVAYLEPHLDHVCRLHARAEARVRELEERIAALEAQLATRGACQCGADDVCALAKRAQEAERELDRVRVDLVTAQHAIGEGWFAGGADTATAIERKTRALEDGARDAGARAAAAEERAQEAEARVATLESRLAEVERERDSVRETNAAMDRGIEAIAVALGTTGADLGFDHDALVNKAKDLRARLTRIEAAAREAADLLGVVASEVEGDAASVYGQVRWARDARRVEASIRAALEGGR